MLSVSKRDVKQSFFIFIFNMIIMDVFSDFSSVESEFCIEEKSGLKLALVSIFYETLL